MLSELPPELHTQTGLFDSVWAYFLHDYDNMEDERSSFDSNDEALSVDEYESVQSERSVAKVITASKSDYSREQELKKSILKASLKRSSELLAYSRRLEARQRNVAHDRSTIAKKGVVNNKVIKNKKYLSRNLDKRGPIDRGSSDRSSSVRENFRRTEQLLEYSRRRDSGRKRLLYDKTMVTKESIPTNTKYVSNDYGSRDSIFPGNSDADGLRDGPPKMIFVEKNHRGVVDTDSASRARKELSFQTTFSRNGFRANVNEKPLSFIDKGEHSKISSSYPEKKVEDYNASQKRREILRRIALLRIQAAKNSNSREIV